MSTDSSMDFSQTMLELNEAINELREREVEETRCSFCGKSQSQVNLMIPGKNDGVCICDQCVARAARLANLRT